MGLRLNEQQRAAVEAEGGAALVLAGAGSGKTRVLTARIARLVDSQGIRPENIFAVTFTNRAAGEMRRRVAEILGRDPAGLWIGTFHSLSARLLRREAERIGFTRQFSIYDDADQLALIKRLIDAAGHSPKAFPPRMIRSIISNAKNRMVLPEELASSATDPIERVAADIFFEYGRALLARNAMDFDDLLLHPLTLFREHPDSLKKYQERFKAVLVDEFQDTNRAQYLLVRSLSGKHGNLCVVGDDDQSIYGWRGADVRNMLDFQQDFPDASMYRLEHNYRSTQMILDAANGVIADNTQRLGKTLVTDRGAGEPAQIVASADERDEAEWVAREIRQIVGTDLFVYKDVAVLYRTNAQSRVFEEVFRRMAIPHRVVGSVSFFQRREIKDLIAYLRLIVNPKDNEAFLRAIQVPKRGLGLASLRHVQDASQKWDKPWLEIAGIADRISELRPNAKSALVSFAQMMEKMRETVGDALPTVALEHVVQTINYEEHLSAEGPEGIERVEHVRELLSGAAEWEEDGDAEMDGTPLEQFLASSALSGSDESTQGDPEGVQLMTVHTAKGLEFPVVVVSGLEDGLFPLSRALETVEGSEEERRLLYVAITRAQDRLFLTWARARRRAGQLMPGQPSRFLESVPPEVSEERRTSGMFGGDWGRRPKPHTTAVKKSFDEWNEGTSVPKAENESQDSPRYIKGERVKHKTFGSGVILGLQGAGRDLKVTVEFDDEEAATKTLLVAYAGLERDWEAA